MVVKWTGQGQHRSMLNMWERSVWPHALHNEHHNFKNWNGYKLAAEDPTVGQAGGDIFQRICGYRKWYFQWPNMVLLVTKMKSRSHDIWKLIRRTQSERLELVAIYGPAVNCLQREASSTVQHCASCKLQSATYVHCTTCKLHWGIISLWAEDNISQLR